MAEITLDCIEAENLITLQSWRNSANVMPYCRQHRLLTMDDMEEWYEAGDRDNLFLIRKDNEPIGVGGIIRIDWRNRKGEISFYVAEEKNKECIEPALLQILDYGSKTLGLHKMYFPCYQGNPYIPLYERCMTKEYVAKSEYYWEGKYLDRIILVKYNGNI